jgi:predicted dehydrogenase
MYWWRQAKLSGGQAVEQTTHIFDLARYLVGEVETVFASGLRGITTENEMPNFDIHDASSVHLRFANGAVGSITSTCILSQGGPVDLNVYTQDTTLRIGGGALHIRKPGVEETHQDKTNATAAEHEAFLAAIEKRNGPPILSSYADALKTLELTFAANRSMETGKPVAI